MSERDFCFWLWGFMELNYTDSPTVDQWKCIKAHLATVFDKKAPDVNDIKKAYQDYDLKRAIKEYQDAQKQGTGIFSHIYDDKVTC